MANVSLKVLLFCVGVFAAGAGAAYFSGAFDPVKEQAVEMASVAVPESSGEEQPSQDGTPAASPLREDTETGGENDAAGSAGSADDVVVPTFDLLRVEPDGSMVVAGRAAPGAEVEVLSGSSVLATTTANDSGEFAAVLDKALKPGEHNIVLRGISPDNVATSVETAIVSIPSSEEGEVVALVQEPGAPSRLITVPQARLPETLDETAENRQVAGGSETGDAPVNDGAHAHAEERRPVGEGQGGEAEAASKETMTDSEAVGTVADARPQEATASGKKDGANAGAEGVSPFIEAVEIDGRKIFVAGRAEPGRRVRVYVNDILLGQTEVSPEGAFLIEAERDLPVGDYIIRADVLGDDGSTVIARAAVPFERPAGEKFAAVAGAKDRALLPGENTKNDAPGASGGQSGRVLERDDEKAERVARVEPGDGAARKGVDGDATGGDIVLPPLEPSDGAVIIRGGDTLWQISRRLYGHGVRYTTIYLANQDQIRNPDLIYPGQIFAVPEETEQGERANLDAIDEQALSPDEIGSSDTDS